MPTNRGIDWTQFQIGVQINMSDSQLRAEIFVKIKIILCQWQYNEFLHDWKHIFIWRMPTDKYIRICELVKISFSLSSKFNSTV